MEISRQLKKKSIPVFLASCLMAGAATVHAQDSACVYLEPGAGYAAWMRVVSGNYASEWSSSFPIGQTRCQSLKAIKEGQEFTVQVSAVLGSSKVPCSPSLKRVAAPVSATYHAWGTTLSVKCKMPEANAETTAGDVTPSKEGLAAKEQLEAGKLPKQPAD